MPNTKPTKPSLADKSDEHIASSLNSLEANTSSKLSLNSHSGPKISATSQTSRFHVDTISTHSQEIDLYQVNISVGLNDLLVDAHLRLKTGVHYVLAGRNGEGKSTLLKAISNRIISGLPGNLRILLVSQVDDNDEVSVLAGEDEERRPDPELTVTERVVKSDRRRNRAVMEQQVLLDAYESSSTSAVVEAVFSIRLSRAKDEAEEAMKVAQRRSGTRGSEARKQLLKAEAKVSEYEQRLLNADWGQWGAANDTKTSLDATELLSDIQDTLDSLGADSTEPRARAILLGLGFKQTQLDAKFKTLSGGWRSRCSLASALLQQPDLLMLDESTNYLDIMSVIWLQYYLKTISSTLLMVAHDREFVDAIAQETIILRNKKLTYFNGNLTESERHARSERKGKIRMQEAMDKKRGAIEKSIEMGARSAKKTGDENRARMVKSRQKKLEDRWGMERSDKGTRFKLNRDMAGFHLASRAEIQIEDFDTPIKLNFPDPEPLRFPGALISANSISFAYSGSATRVLDDVTLTIHPGARVGLVGKNGEGKSTLVKLLVGILRPLKGTVERHSRLRLGYFDQHSVEILSGPEAAGTSALELFIKQLKEKHTIEIDEQTGRSFLGSFGLRGRTATNPVSTLSGGQKVRLALALVVFPAPDLLVLDEATTHLDKDTIVSLIRALRQYTGAVLLVSHDRHFIRCVIEGAPVLSPSSEAEDEDEKSDDESDGKACEKTGMVIYVGKGKVKPLSGGIDDYVVLVEKQMKRLGLIEKG